jgi:hypothetical protein
MFLYLVFILWVMRPFGAAEQAAFGIGQRLLQAGMMPIMAISFAASAVAGQNYGARLMHRVRETFHACLKIGFCCCLVLFALGELLPGPLVGAFTSDPAVIAGGVEFVRVVGFNLLATTVAFSCFGVLSGLGNTVPTLISSATRIVLIIVPAWLLSSHAGFRPLWVWLLSVGATLVQAGMNLWFLRRELNRKLGPAQTAPPAAAAACGGGAVGRSAPATAAQLQEAAPIAGKPWRFTWCLGTPPECGPQVGALCRFSHGQCAGRGRKELAVQPCNECFSAMQQSFRF